MCFHSFLGVFGFGVLHLMRQILSLLENNYTKPVALGIRGALIFISRFFRISKRIEAVRGL